MIIFLSLGVGVVRPHITDRPSHTHAFPGETVTLRCQGDQYVESYHWLHSGRRVEASSRVTIVMGHGLTISNVTDGDSGVYTCVAVGANTSVEASAFLNVTGPLISCQGTLYGHVAILLQL